MNLALLKEMPLQQEFAVADWLRRVGIPAEAQRLNPKGCKCTHSVTGAGTTGEAEESVSAGESQPVMTANALLSKEAPTASDLQLMPNEILSHIFGYLDEVESASLGVTCKTLYASHTHLHPPGKIPLWRAWDWVLWGPPPLKPAFTCEKCSAQPCQLYKHLGGWMKSGAGGERHFCYSCKMFVWEKKGSHSSCERCRKVVLKKRPRVV